MRPGDSKHGIQADRPGGSDTRLQAGLPMPQVRQGEFCPTPPVPFPFLGAVCGLLLGALAPFTIARAELSEANVVGHTYPPPASGNHFSVSHFQLILWPGVILYESNIRYESRFDETTKERRLLWSWRVLMPLCCAALGFYLGFRLGRGRQRRESLHRHWQWVAEDCRA